MNTRAKYKDVIRKLRQGLPANDFDDGLKFVGRVQDIRKLLAQTPDGLRTVRYNLAAVGFSELDSSVFFDPNLSRNEQYIERVLQHLSIPMAEIYNTAAEEAQAGKGGIDINKVIPALIKAFIGEGISGVGVASGGIQLATGASVATKEAPYAYVVPDGVAQILGVKVPSKKESGVYSYADILETIQGLQKYEGNHFPQLFFPKMSVDTEFGQVFGRDETSNRHFTAYPLKGLFMPTAVSFDNKTVWNLLNEFLNPAVNEMYTAVRYTPSGRVMPTLVIRQLPFSSPVLTQKHGSKVTSFHELPRWRADPVLVRGMDVGRSDGERINFIHIYGIPAKQVLGSDMSTQLTLHPPVSDFQDMKRHGLRPHMGQINVSPVDIANGGPGEWMSLRADFLMGQHLMLTGICSMVGVTLPIAPGDNFEFEDTLYHIESVHHHCSITPDGGKSFTTQVSLSHGVRADVPAAIARVPSSIRVKKKAHLREDRIAQHKKYLSRASSKAIASGKLLRRFGGIDAFNEAVRLAEEGVEMDVLEGGGNPDIYLYSGIHDEDNTSMDPGLSIDAEDDDVHES
jgi:hypothetical protein